MKTTKAAVALLLAAAAFLGGCASAPGSYQGASHFDSMGPAPGHHTLPNYILNGDASS